MATDNMGAVTKSIEGVLNDNPKLRIPIFQRDYSWKKDNWKELWEDINIGFQSSNKHYLGSIVLVDDKCSGYKDIVDGQQRLTTISIIYLAIVSNFFELVSKDIDKDANLKRANDIKGLICETNLYNMSSINRLQLNENNNNIYSEYLVKDALPDESIKLSESNKQLVECFKYFKRAIRKVCTETDKSYPSSTLLLDYYTYICKNLIIIEIIASDYHNAYVIFETLNDRGLDLTVTDLLKNYLFSKVHFSKHTKIKKYWGDIINNVDEKNTTKFIRHYWNSFNKKITEKDLFRVIKENVNTEATVLEFVKKLNEMSYVYSAISDPKNKLWKGDKELTRYLEEIKLFKVDLCYPVFLAVHNNITKSHIKRKLFRLCSIISLRYIIVCNGGANDLERAYNDLCININKYKDDIDLNKVAKDMKEFIVDEEKFIIGFKEKIIKTKNNKKLITYILKGIERNLGSQIGEDITIEHILPENYSEEWDVKFNHEATDYIYRLGNYILLEKDYNNDISDESFNEKTTYYKKSKYKEANKISTIVDWNPTEIDRHQKNMAIMAQSIWKF